MSLPEFDTLLAQHPEDAAAIMGLEIAIVRSLQRDRNTRFDITLVLHHLRTSNITVTKVKRLLVELVREEALQQLLFWECPNGRGPIFESPELASFPDQLNCDRCGEVHWFAGEHVQVGFIATRRLQEEVAEAAT